MSIFYQEEPTNHHSNKRSKFLVTALKDAFSNCHNFHGRLPSSGLEEEYQTCDFDEEHEVVVSEIRSRAMEKLRRKPGIRSDSFSWVVSPITREIYIKAIQQKEEGDDDDNDDDDDDDAKEEFFSVGSCLSCNKSAMSRETFYSVKTNLSRSSSLDGLDYRDIRKKLDNFQDLRRSIIEELCYCEGWPFGLCMKAVLLPPLPKSPSESWSWRKGK